MPIKTSKRRNSAKRKRSTFKPSNGTQLRARPKIVIGRDNSAYKTYYQGGGYGHLTNNCRCHDCDPNYRANRRGGLFGLGGI